ncbi:MAG: DUF7541 family protein [Haloferacaceae archaeon]
MNEQPGLSDQYRKVSPWPMFIAFGLALSEIGILFNLFPLAVGGLLLLGGSVAGILTEAGYVETPWRALVWCAGVLVVFGAVLVYVGSLPVTTGTQLDERGYAVLTTALVMALGAVGGRFLVQRSEPAV